jgi:hypothetical protein
MDNTANYSQMGFNLPHDVVKLPSGGVFYKSKKKSIKVGYLTAADENLLMADNTNNSNEIILTLLRNKIYESDIRPEELLEGDIQAILIFLRNSAFGPEYNISYIDSDSNKEIEATILLDELSIRDVEYKPNENGYFEVELTKSKFIAKIKPLSYGEMIELEKLSDSYPTGRPVPKQTWKLNKLIIELNGSSDRSIIAKNIEELPISDAKYIRKFIEQNEPKIDLRKKIVTPSGKETFVNFGFGVEFFRPFF